MRVAYPSKTKVLFRGKEEDFVPYTFEDALVFSNYRFFSKEGDDSGLIKKIRKEFADEASLNEAHQWLYKTFYEEGSNKGPFAADLLYSNDFPELKAPEYITEGLLWLQKKLNEDAE